MSSRFSGRLFLIRQEGEHLRETPDGHTQSSKVTQVYFKEEKERLYFNFMKGFFYFYLKAQMKFNLQANLFAINFKTGGTVHSM